MVKLALIAVSTVIATTGCSPKISKDAAQVAFHHQMSQLLDGCERLGPVKVVYKSQLLLSNAEEEMQVTSEMRQIAFDEYGADSVVFINTERVRGKLGKGDTIYGQGEAFRCGR